MACDGVHAHGQAAGSLGAAALRPHRAAADRLGHLRALRDELLTAARLETFASAHIDSISALGIDTEFVRSVWIFCFVLTLLFESIYVLYVMLAMPLISYPSDPDFNEVPDVGHLLVVLYKLGIWKAVAVYSSGCDPRLSRIGRVLALLEREGVIELVSDADVAARAECQQPLVCVVDLDSCSPPPRGLTAERMEFCIAWSETEGFGALVRPSCAPWAPLVRHTIVGQPAKSDYMLEGVLCRVLQALLTSPGLPALHASPALRTLHALHALHALHNFTCAAYVASCRRSSRRSMRTR